ncbi:MAG: SGNH/GDSL hydrolase family protein [Clostridia bacterium]|nr:SGNH/GDSL hydrolase family protein [Clostridia bacterium]
MNYIGKYSSNTLASGANQDWFVPEGKVTSRVFYKITTGGEYNYKLFYSNITDSTFADGSHSRKNNVCDPWTIHSLSVASCSDIDTSELEMKQLTFSGNTQKYVAPGEFFETDPILLRFEKDEYICIEMTFSGTKVPYFYELLVPGFVKNENGFEPAKLFPVPYLIGCDRPVKTKIAFVGDSITEGIGTKSNSYDHWVAKIGNSLGNDYSVWDLGIGYGRGDDFATNSAWMFKAKQADFVSICFGVNDINRGKGPVLIENLNYIIDTLKASGVRVGLFTVPPFDYNDAREPLRLELNERIKTELSQKVEYVFDFSKYLGKEEAPNLSKYGGHPNAQGCALVADKFMKFLKEKNIEL